MHTDVIVMNQKGWIDVMTAIAQIFIAGSVAYVAFKSYYLNKEQYRLTLFEKRYKVFSVVKKFFDDFIPTATIEDENLSRFFSGTVEADFLFGKDVVDYKQEIIDKSFKLRQTHLELRRGVSDDQVRGRLADESMELETWFANQNKSVKKIFEKYLYFDL